MVRNILYVTFAVAASIVTTSSAGDLGQSTPPKTGIQIKTAVYGDVQGKKTCVPTLSICTGRALCEFVVDDGLCKVDAAVKNLEVQWVCGESTTPKARAAAKGTKITLACP
jgi:hypothetical protein